MKVSRFGVARLLAPVAFILLAAAGVGVCLHALGVLTGLFEPGRLPPPYRLWTASHFVSSAVFVPLALMQLTPPIRRRWPAFHRASGRTAVLAASLMALSGVAIAYLEPDRPLAERLFMTTFFSIFAACLARGFLAARAREFTTHRAWMTRMSVLSLTPITQRLVFGVLAATNGIDGEQTFWELFVSAAWLALVVNTVSVEWWLRSGRPAAAPAGAMRLSPSAAP